MKLVTLQFLFAISICACAADTVGEAKHREMISFPNRTLQEWSEENAILEAQADIREGKAKLYVSGTIAAYAPGIPTEKYEKLKSLPNADAGIGCVIDDERLRKAQFAYAMAYNRYVAEHYESK